MKSLYEVTVGAIRLSDLQFVNPPALGKGSSRLPSFQTSVHLKN